MDSTGGQGTHALQVQCEGCGALLEVRAPGPAPWPAHAAGALSRRQRCALRCVCMDSLFSPRAVSEGNLTSDKVAR